MVSYSDSVPSNLTAVANNNIQQPDQAVFEADKRAVYKHPLFPLLALLFERCEQATQSATISNSESFNMDIQAFVQHQERDRKPFLINDQEIDGLMIKAIQVLRIHLLELEKVQELCKDFCSRYITCLKIKMQSENLLRSDYTSGYLENNSSGNSSNSNSPLCHSPHHIQVISSSGVSVRQSGDHDSIKPKTIMDLKNITSLLSNIPSSTSVEMKDVSQDGTQLDLTVTKPTPENSSLEKTPFSSIGTNLLTSNVSILHGSLSTTSGGSCDEEDDYFGSKKKRQQKRGILPKHATSVMRSWLFQHLIHPYPTEDEKKIIAAQTNLTLLQVNNWFINARRRILQPMLDASTSDISGESNFTLSKDKSVIIENNKFSWPVDEILQSQNINENSNESNFDESEEEEEISDIFSQHSVNESD
ncbi:Homeobox domain,Homeobox domain-like,Homeobox KN domain,Homeobox protein PKNOX/Meis, N-terminal [Cinara cedri]|uniref:Homeobox domain,Homeobox domain-like,Homeobox KN domain,Homeobox protein PKNOX/Meis, N-terminal n=1 Tax=Cinara cedri TaxID=506608 RepID=A0A5E4NAB2_9HEMI|nr:Homeobox domain,Homeobox domain-like,Homeobox KN domain,Homeobox protein PKNOX/Meis, N-terminal [Cinara cedri]